MDVKLLQAECLTLEPDEVLVVRVGRGEPQGVGEAIAYLFEELGLGGRVVVFQGNYEFTKIKKGQG